MRTISVLKREASEQKVRSAISIMMLALLVMAFCMRMTVGVAYAEDGSSDTSRLSVVTEYGQGAEVTPVAGFTLGIYQVATLTSERGFVPTEEFADITADLNAPMKASEIDGLAKTLAEKAKGLTPISTATTAADGKVVFEPLANGVYLVTQLEAKGDAKDYFAVDPVLISVPQFIEGSEPNRDVVTYLKLESNKQPPVDVDTGGKRVPDNKPTEPTKEEITEAVETLPLWIPPIFYDSTVPWYDPDSWRNYRTDPTRSSSVYTTGTWGNGYSGVGYTPAPDIAGGQLSNAATAGTGTAGTASAGTLAVSNPAAGASSTPTTGTTPAAKVPVTADTTDWMLVVACAGFGAIALYAAVRSKRNAA